MSHHSWGDSIDDGGLAARQQAWIDGVDAAIARMRRREGFDGTQRTWNTLGECLLPDTKPAQTKPRRINGRRVVECGFCGVPRFYGLECAPCQARMDRLRRRAG